MKAIVYRRYGGSDALHLEDAQRPTPGPGEVLVEVHAASVNSWDVDLLRGRPFVTRLAAPLRPKHPILGSDVAGVVTAVGKGVEDLAPGDAVFGDLSGAGWGAFAEYVCAPESRLVLKPAKMSFEEAAAIPQAGLLAYQGLREGGGVKKGDRLLVNGGGGGAGTFAIQLARREGAIITAVDRGEKLELMRTLGADHVIDYELADPTRVKRPYEFVLDVSLHRSPFDWARALAPGGRYVALGGETPRLLELAAIGPMVRRTQGKHLSLLILKWRREDLETLARLFEAGTVDPIIDRSYRLAETPAAIERLAEGHTLGKVVVVVRKEKARARPTPARAGAAAPRARG